MASQLRRAFSTTILKGDSNQALQLGKYAINFMDRCRPSAKVIQKCKLLHTDSVISGFSALALKASSATLLRNQALQYSVGRVPRTQYGKVFGSSDNVIIQKAIAANSVAMKEWQSNGTTIGYNGSENKETVEFMSCDFYSVVIAAANLNPRITGAMALKAMVLQDQIKGRMAEVFSLTKYKFDNAIFGAIASICTYGALTGASPKIIESGIGIFISHYTSWTANQVCGEMNDSRIASTGLIMEIAIISIKRAMRGFIGPQDIFRNPEALFRMNEQTNGESPFSLTLSKEGDNFSVMKTHFKLGLYNHQSSGAIQAICKLIKQYKYVSQFNIDDIENISIFLCNSVLKMMESPSNLTPTSRHSALKSVPFIISSLIKKSFQSKDLRMRLGSLKNVEEVMKILMLQPKDYSYLAIMNQKTRKLMKKIQFKYGGQEYDKGYPQGIPTSVSIKFKEGKTLVSDLIMYPTGHSKNISNSLQNILGHKNHILGKLVFSEFELKQKLGVLNSLQRVSNKQLIGLYSGRIGFKKFSIDHENYDE